MSEAVEQETVQEAVLGVAILSKSTNAEQRQVLRDTWFQLPSVVNGSVTKRFFIARPTEPTLSALQAEAAKHGDITIIEQMEGYDNLPYQTMAGLKHFSQDEKARFIVKADDDVFVRAEVMHKHFRGLMEEYSPNSRLFIGWMVEGAKPHRNGKWAISKTEYPSEEYPVYASGPSYCMSRALAVKVVKKAAKMKWIKLEDVGTGVWVEKVKRSSTVLQWNERRFHKGRICAPWAWTILLEKGRPLLFEQDDVARAMAQLREREEAGRGGAEVECPEGTSLLEVSARIRCDAKIKGEDGAGRCAGWLAANQASPPRKRDPKLFFNLFPGGGEQIQRSAEGAVLKEAEKAEADWKETWSKGVQPEVTGTEKEKEKEKEGKSASKEAVVVVVRDDLRSYHPLLHAEGPQLCAVPCVFKLAFGEGGAKEQGDASLFLGDLEIYRKDPGRRPLPKPKGGELRAVALREAVSKFPPQAWSKYDINVTYARAAHVPFGYIDSLEVLLEAAEASLKGDAQRSVLMSAVALRCGKEGDKADRRAQRTALIKELAALLDLRSYGHCANNAPWPEGYHKDKAFVTAQSRFCLAFENSEDSDYVTEKLFDCLAAGAVPVVSGGAHVREFAPPGGALFVEDFPSTAALAHKILQVDKDAEAYGAMREWITERSMEGWAAWAERMRAVEGVGARCRLCEHVAHRRKLLFPQFQPAPEDQRRAAHRAEVAAAKDKETKDRKRLADPKKVKVEL